MTSTKEKINNFFRKQMKDDNKAFALSDELLEQVSGGAVGGTMNSGITTEIRPGQTGTVFIRGFKFASIAGLTADELNAIKPDDPRYSLVQEYFTFMARREQARQN